MKKIFTLAVFALCFLTYGYGQNVQGGGFEEWRYVPAYHYYEPINSIFSTLDTLLYAPTPSGITAYRCDTVHSGTYSARLVTSKIDALFVIIPGVIGTIKTDWATSKGILGTPYPYGNNLPGWFSGYYQSYPVAGDSIAAVVLLSKWNPGTLKRDTLAYNRLAFHGTINSWTLFETPITYRDHSTMPDSLTVLLLSCAGFNAAQMFGSVGQVGSMALFDDVNLSGFSGIPTLIVPSVNVKLSPIPAFQNMKIELSGSVANGFFEVYDAQAKFIRKQSINGNSGQIGVSDLSAGTYFYKLIQNEKLLNSGTFVVIK
jgi:hypothetical protein